jgi:hypothetical protein
MSEEFLGEFPPFASMTPRGAAPPAGFVPGNYVAEPGEYVCVLCEGGLVPPPLLLKAGQRLPPCARCGPSGRWVKR